ncbi:ATP-binding protein [Luedemannella helvata]|uniref:Histidine kinase/HSP90-like ATPase domain-containing protein n=1 Tax=Luedemannella helvata TaxID=349315 RepID=A0ABP4W5K3_9ACTN
MSPAADSMFYAAAADLVAVRAFVRARGLALGLATGRADLLTLAVSELATNTLMHTAGGGHVRVWFDGGQVVCDVVDGGPDRSVAGAMPAASAEGGRGLAIVGLICDDVTTHPVIGGTLVRLRFSP